MKPLIACLIFHMYIYMISLILCIHILFSLCKPGCAKVWRRVHWLHWPSAQDQGAVWTGWAHHCTLQVMLKWTIKGNVCICQCLWAWHLILVVFIHCTEKKMGMTLRTIRWWLIEIQIVIFFCKVNILLQLTENHGNLWGLLQG